MKLHEKSFLFYVATLPVMWPFVRVRGSALHVSDAVLAFTLAAWLVERVRERNRRIDAFHLALAAYAAVMVASAIGSVEPRTSGWKLLLEGWLLAIAVVAYESVPDVRRFASAWLVGTALHVAASFVGIISFYVGKDSFALADYGSLPAGSYPRVRGSFLNFNMAASYLVASVVFALERKAVALLVAIAVALAFTISPGIGGALLAAGMFFYAQKRSRVALALGGLAAVMFIVAATFSSAFVVDGRIEPSLRRLCWETAVEVVSERPLLGLGTGMNVHCKPWASAVGVVHQLEDAHQMYLNVAATKGVFGLAAFLAVIVVALRGARRDAMLAIALVCAVLYQGLTGSFEHTRHVWVLIGVVAARSRSGRGIFGAVVREEAGVTTLHDRERDEADEDREP